jgi:hypothetical protein
LTKKLIFAINVSKSKQIKNENKKMTEALTTTPETEFDRIRTEVTPLLELGDDSFTAAGEVFIAGRLAELTAGSSAEKIDANGGNMKGFIHPESEIFPAAGGTGYRLDDRTIYDAVMPYMRSAHAYVSAHVQDPQKAYLNAALITAQNVQQGYFGTVYNGPGTLAQHAELVGGDFMLDDDEDPGPDYRSIAEFKGVAMCTERTAIANNVLQILGVQPVLEMGKLQIDDRVEELHTYLFVKSPSGQEQVLDPMNPTLTYDAAGSLLMTSPAFYPAGDALSVRDPGQPIVGIHKNYQFDDQGKHVLNEQTYHFWINRFGEELHPE